MPYLVDPVLDPGRLTGPQPEIPGDGLRLRRWSVQDAPTLFAAFQDEAIRKWNLRSLDSTAEAAKLVTAWKQGWKRHVAASWAVVRAPSGDVLGQVGFRSLYPVDGMAEISYWVMPGYRRQGIATRATGILADWAFRDLGLMRLELVHSVRNPESCWVAKAAGFEFEGVKRRLQRHVDGWHDMCLHARIADAGPVAMPRRARVIERLERSLRAEDAGGRALALAGVRY